MCFLPEETIIICHNHITIINDYVKPPRKVMFDLNKNEIKTYFLSKEERTDKKKSSDINSFKNVKNEINN